MRNKRDLKLNNEGFSLVELIVTVLLMAAVMGIVVAFISTSRRSYEIVGTDTKLQTESEVATTFIKNIAVEASTGGMGGFDDNNGKPCQVIWFLGPDNNGTSIEEYYYFIVHDYSNECLRYKKIKASDVADTNFSETTLKGLLLDVINNPYQLLAENVKRSDYNAADTNKNWYIRLSSDRNTQGSLITVDIHFEFNGVEYPVSVKAVSRNYVAPATP